jgi:hypothetical protein
MDNGLPFIFDLHMLRLSLEDQKYIYKSMNCAGVWNNGFDEEEMDGLIKTISRMD